MKGLDLGALARAAEAQVVGGPLPEGVRAVGTDSRALPPDCLFAALRGERFDGHGFVKQAVQQGARAVLIDARGAAELGELPVPRLIVADTQKALGDMARALRRAWKKPVAAVTGSNGKTTTKEMLAAALAERGPVHRTAGNLNNLIGLPLTVFAWPSDAWAGVLEMGMNVPGEIARLTEIAEPDVGVITMVGPAHLEGLGSVDGVGRAKGELFAGLPEGATGVVNLDDQVIVRVAAPLLAKRRRLTFGRSPKADVAVLSTSPRPAGLAARLAVQGEPLELELPLVGAHNALNAAAALAAGLALGLSARELARGLSKTAVPGGRLRMARGEARGIGLIDDTYNANPASMRAAFAALGDVAGGARRVAVLGSMYELGKEAAALHHEVGLEAARSGVAWLLALGEHGPELARGAEAGGARGAAFPDIEALMKALDAGLKKGDWVLVKGSRGMKMERVVRFLEGGQG